MLMLKCVHCNKLVINTEGTDDATRIVSLMKNLGNHVKRKHPEPHESDAEVHSHVANSAATVLLLDNSDWIASEDGNATKVLLEKVVEEAVTIVTKALDIDVGDDDDDEAEDAEGNNGEPEEGVVEDIALEPPKEADKELEEPISK